MRKDFAGCLSKVSYHDAQIRALNNSIDDMKKRIRLAEQIGLKHEIVINGIPGDLSLGESAIVTKVAGAVGVQLFSTDIERTRTKNGMIIVEFSNSKVRNVHENEGRYTLMKSTLDAICCLLDLLRVTPGRLQITSVITRRSSSTKIWPEKPDRF